MQKECRAKFKNIRYHFNSEKEAKDRKTVATYVPDINNDCIKNRFNIFFSKKQVSSSKRNNQ